MPSVNIRQQVISLTNRLALCHSLTQEASSCLGSLCELRKAKITNVCPIRHAPRIKVGVLERIDERRRNQHFLARQIVDIIQNSGQ